jgi:hypothetical protein
MKGYVSKEPVAAAMRMRSYRERRREGWRCVRLTIHWENIKSLVGKGYLKPDMCHDQTAIELAVDNSLTMNCDACGRNS